MLKIPFQFFWIFQNCVLSWKHSVWRKNSMFCGLFNFDQNRCIRTLLTWPFFFVDFLKCWKYPSNSSETFKMLFFHEDKQFEGKKSNFGGHFNFDQNRCIRPLPAWPFFWLIFWNVENTLPILLKNPKFCSFIKTISLKQKLHVLRTFQFWPKSLYPDLCGVAIFLLDFLKCGKYPSNSCETFKMLFFHENKTVWRKNSMFCGLFNFDQYRCIRTLPACPFFWLIFSNVENTLPILLKHSKFCCFMKRKHAILFHEKKQFEEKKAILGDFSILTKITVSWPQRRGHFFAWFFEILKIPFQLFWNIQNVVVSWKETVCQNWKVRKTRKKKQFLGTFQFRPKSLYPDVTGVGIFWDDFFGWFFEMLKIPFEFYGNIQNCVLSWKHSFWRKNIMFCGLFNFDKNRCIRTLPAWPFFLVDFFKCWKYPSNSSETFKILLFHEKKQFEEKKAILGDFSILTKITVSWPQRRGHFFAWFFEILKIPFQLFWNIQNVVVSWKETVWRKKKQFLGTFQFRPKSLYPDVTGVGIFWDDFFGWFFEMLKIPFEFYGNIQNCVLSWKHSFWRKNIMFCGLFNFDKNRCIRTLPAWPFFLVDFLKCWKYPSNCSETFKMLFLHENKQFEAKRACFADFSILTKIAVSGPYRRGQFFGWFFEMLKILFQLFWNIQNVVLSWKQTVWRKNSMFCGLFNFDQNRCIRTLPAWPFFWLIFWNVENTFPIVLKHSKCCSFMKTNSLKKK